MQELILNKNFEKLSSVGDIGRGIKGAYNTFNDNTNYQGKVYTGLAGAGAYAGARGAKFLNRASRAAFGTPGGYGVGKGALAGAGLAMGLKGAYDYSRWVNQGKMTGKQLGASAGLHGLGGGALGTLVSGGGIKGGLLGAGAGLAYKAYKDYKKYGG
jgi:hypothetical protein